MNVIMTTPQVNTLMCTSEQNDTIQIHLEILCVSVFMFYSKVLQQDIDVFFFIFKATMFL